MVDVERGGRARAPHGLLLAVVVVVVVAGPFFMGDGGGGGGKGGVTESIPALIGPAWLLLIPVTLVLLIRFLSSDRGVALSDIISAGSPDSIHHVGGSPVGVAFLVLVLVILLYYRVSLFGGGGGDESGV